MNINWRELKPIISSANLGVNNYLSVLDENGHVILANARMQKEFILKDPKQVKINFFDLVHPLHVEDFRQAIHYSSENNSSYSIEIHLKNGIYHPMKWNVSYLPFNKDDSKTYLCYGHLTEKTAGEEKLLLPGIQLGEILFKAFMKNTPYMTWVINEEANLVFANDVFFQYFHLNDSSLNKKIADLLPLAVSDSLYEKHAKVLQTSRSVEAIETGKSVDGSTVIFRIILFRIDENEAGKKLVCGIAINQSENYKTEQKLKVANERLVHFNRATSDAIWEWDMKTGKIFRNEKLIEMTGYLAEDHSGLSWWLGRIHRDDRDQVMDTLKDVTDDSLQSWESEYRFLCADGEYKNMFDHGYVIYENGMPVKMIGSLSDITNEKLMENLLLEEKLGQYKKISETVMRVQEQERTRLGREMHDNVNQILSTIKLFVGMLTPANEKEKGIKKKAIDYTMLAVEEIRKLSREMVAPQLDGGSLAEHICSVVSDLELSTNIKIKFTHDTEIELLNPGKKLTLFRIVQEQVKNILKYSKATHAEILLQCRNNKVQLMISDNGVGFDMKNTSTGIGLSSIRDRVKFYNGHTEIKSFPGLGCQVVISIPV